MRRWPPPRWGTVACAVLLAATVLTGCGQSPPDRRTQSDALAAHIRALPGVNTASNDVDNDVDKGDTHVWLSVDVADHATADQVAAVTAAFLDDLQATGYPGYQTELTIHHGRSRFAVEGGRDPLTNGGQIVAQARDWIAMGSQFAGAAIDLRATIAHPPTTQPARNGSHPVLATVVLPGQGDYRDVSAAFAVLGSRFPQLADGSWTVSAGSAHPAVVTSSKRLPTGQELDVWNRLNADQAIPHVDAMTINAPFTAPVWISEKTISRDTAVAVQLAAAHLPIVATLPAPVLYTATDKLQAHRNYDGHVTGPVAVTIGGCTPREYRPDSAEQKLAAPYERCPRPPT